jgi:hypothetical protein
MAIAMTDMNISFAVNLFSELRQFLQHAHPITMSSLYVANAYWHPINEPSFIFRNFISGLYELSC